MFILHRWVEILFYLIQITTEFTDLPSKYYLISELYSANKSKEVWVQCQGQCKRWAHELCAGVENIDEYQCEFCLKKKENPMLKDKITLKKKFKI